MPQDTAALPAPVTAATVPHTSASANSHPRSTIATARTGRRVQSLSGRQKAAVLVRLLLAEGADIKLSSLPDELQTSLTEQIGEMRLVDRDTLANVVLEFVETMEQVGLSFPGGIEGALKALDGHLSPTASSSLKRKALRRDGADPWQSIVTCDAETLIDVLEPESAEVAAVVLSKLSVSRAADLLGKMPGERARRVAYAVSLTEGIAPPMVARIGASIAHEIDRRPQKAFQAAPEARVGAILNSATGPVRDVLLSGLTEQDQGFADGVRKAIFTFEHIYERLGPRDVPRVLREVPQPELITALAAALVAQGSENEKSAEFLLANMSQRMAGTLRDEVETRGKVKAKDAETAMAQVVSVIRDLAEANEITLLTEDEDE